MPLFGALLVVGGRTGDRLGRKGAFLATEAASSLGLYLSKSVTFERFGALTPDIALKGLIAGSSLTFGAFIAKRAPEFRGD